MATTTYVKVEDDIDGSEGATTIAFGLEGLAYEIDLNDEHLAQLREAMQPFIEKARRAGRARQAAASGGSTRPPSALAGRPTLLREKGFDSTTVREWAQANGEAINERGRIPDAIVLAYEASLSKTPRKRGGRKGTAEQEQLADA